MDGIDTLDGVVKSDGTLLKIIDTLHERGSAGVTDLADAVGVSKSAIHKHLKTLEHLNYVVNEQGSYRLGLKFYSYGIGVTQRSELASLLSAKAEALVERTDEIVSVSLEERGMGIFIDILNNEYDLSGISREGTRFYLSTLASGKAMLAEYPDEHIEDIIERHGLPQETPNTITSRDALFEDIQRIREQNYALNKEEKREGMAGIATAVRHPDTDEIGSLAISGPAHRILDETIQSEYTEILLEVVNELDLQMNYG